MRVGFFTDSYFPEVDGVTYTLEAWKQRLEERGHDVYVVYPGNSRYKPDENEIPTHSVPNPFYRGYRLPVPIGLDLPELDVVHCQSPATLGVVGRIHAWRNDLPAVYTHHTPLEEYFSRAVKSERLAGLLEELYIPLEQRFLESFDAVTASTEKIGRDVEHMELPVGLDTDFFHPTEESIIDSMALERPVIGYSGRMSAEKNLDQVLELARRFNGTVVLVGQGPQRKRLERDAPGNVVFRDWVDREELPGFYSSLDVFVTASEGDTLGLSPLEASACGTPVVAADRYPFDETISEGNGLRFEPGNVEDFHGKVRRALKREFSPRDAVEKYSMEKAVDRLEELYGELDGR